MSYSDLEEKWKKEDARTAKNVALSVGLTIFGVLAFAFAIMAYCGYYNLNFSRTCVSGCPNGVYFLDPVHDICLCK